MRRLNVDGHTWSGWRARAYGLFRRNPLASRAVVEWAELEPNSNVLDIGCGPGAAVVIAAEGLVDGTAYGVDPSPDFIRMARQRAADITNAEFRLGAAHQLPFRDGQFDVAWAVHSVHHWSDLEASLPSVRRVLRTGGRFLVVERHATNRPWGMSREQAKGVAQAIGSAGFADVSLSVRSLGRSEELLISGFADSRTSETTAEG